MYTESNLYMSYKYIEAKTPKELEVLMLEVQVKSRRPISFTPPAYTKGKWSTWFLYDYSKELRGQEKIKLETKA